MDLETKALSRSRRACRDLRGRQSSLGLPMGSCIAVMAIQVPAADVVTRTMRGPIAHSWSPRSPYPAPLQSQEGWLRLLLIEGLSDAQKQTANTAGGNWPADGPK